MNAYRDVLLQDLLVCGVVVALENDERRLVAVRPRPLQDKVHRLGRVARNGRVVGEGQRLGDDQSLTGVEIMNGLTCPALMLLSLSTVRVP